MKSQRDFSQSPRAAPSSRLDQLDDLGRVRAEMMGSRVEHRVRHWAQPHGTSGMELRSVR
jgi:hypothetical protein